MHIRVSILLASAISLAAISPARAEQEPDDGHPRDRCLDPLTHCGDREPSSPDPALVGTARWALGAGLMGGFQRIGDIHLDQVGPHLSGQLRAGRWTGVVEAAWLANISPDQRVGCGHVGRAAVAGRFQLRAARFDSSSTAGLFLEAGTGVQRLSWVEGGRLTRPDVHLGFGAHMHGGSNDPKNTRHEGILVSARVIAAAGSEAAVHCKRAAGACDPGPGSVDFGFLFTFSYTRGRRGQ